MFQPIPRTADHETDWKVVAEQARSLWEPGLPLSSNLANMSALLKSVMQRTNWVGFYLWNAQSDELILGPFQGLPACTRIAFGKGVCGTAVRERRTQRVADVHLFPGHIACDSASESEIVVPLIREGSVLGVLDVDSPEKSRFKPSDQSGLEEFAKVIVSLWPAR